MPNGRADDTNLALLWVDCGALAEFGDRSNRWEQTLTIAYRNDQFVVAGYTTDYYDTIDTQ
jgi:hypothetical protein